MARSVKELVSRMEWDGSCYDSERFILQECKGGIYGSNFEHATRGVLSVKVVDSKKTQKYMWVLMDIYDGAQHKQFKNVLQKEDLDNNRELVRLGL